MEFGKFVAANPDGADDPAALQTGFNMI